MLTSGSSVIRCINCPGDSTNKDNMLIITPVSFDPLMSGSPANLTSLSSSLERVMMDESPGMGTMITFLIPRMAPPEPDAVGALSLFLLNNAKLLRRVAMVKDLAPPPLPDSRIFTPKFASL